MTPVISVVGKSNVGKTTYLEKLIRELKARGWRIATVKHDVHGFEIDHPGKDTWRHAQAGADTVVISSPQKLALIINVEREKTLDEIAALITDCDLIITEGYKRGPKPKIEIFRSGCYDELLCGPEELLAVVSDVDLPVEAPRFELDDAAGVADLLETKIIRPASGG